MKAASVFLGVVAILFYFVWLSEAVLAVLVGGVPQSVVEGWAPTNVVHVVDMAWLLPGMLLTAVWLWRERAIAYALAGALLTLLALLVLAIVAMAVVDISLYGAAIFGILSALSSRPRAGCGGVTVTMRAGLCRMLHAHLKPS